MRHPVLAAARHRFRCAAEQLLGHLPRPNNARALGAAGAGADAAAGARADATANNPRTPQPTPGTQAAALRAKLERVASANTAARAQGTRRSRALREKVGRWRAATLAKAQEPKVDDAELAKLRKDNAELGKLRDELAAARRANKQVDRKKKQRHRL